MAGTITSMRWAYEADAIERSEATKRVRRFRKMSILCAKVSASLAGLTIQYTRMSTHYSGIADWAQLPVMIMLYESSSLMRASRPGPVV